LCAIELQFTEICRNPLFLQHSGVQYKSPISRTTIKKYTLGPFIERRIVSDIMEIRRKTVPDGWTGVTPFHALRIRF